MKETDILVNKKILAYCGLYCEQCSFKLAHDENDIKYLISIPNSFEFKELTAYNCQGCKSDYCICGFCKMKPCASAKGIDSCADCEDFPCEHIVAFENDGWPHHKDAIENLRKIKQQGIESWFESVKPLLKCKQCGQRQSWYYFCNEHGNDDIVN